MLGDVASGGAVEGVVGFVKTEGRAVDVGGEVADGGGDTGVECAAVGEMSAETHASGTCKEGWLGRGLSQRGWEEKAGGWGTVPILPV